MASLPRNSILVGDASERLRQLPARSVDCVITSPPYYQLRDYGIRGQIGLEADVRGWVERMRAVMREVARVLKSGGGVWLDLGDSYSRHVRYGAPPKGLLLAPERLVLALSQDGWIVRNKVIWAKTNPMPTSVGDRLNTTYDVVYFMVRNPRYFFELDAIRLPHGTRRRVKGSPVAPASALGPLADQNSGLASGRPDGLPGHPLGKNPGDVWPIATRGFRGQHFATFPPKLVERPLLASCPERLCASCGRPWGRDANIRVIGGERQPAGKDRHVRRYPNAWRTIRALGALRPRCDCDGSVEPGLVLDPFFGTGTVGVVAEQLGRDWLGIELNPLYAKLARQRLDRAGASRTAAAA